MMRKSGMFARAWGASCSRSEEARGGWRYALQQTAQCVRHAVSMVPIGGPNLTRGKGGTSVRL